MTNVTFHRCGIDSDLLTLFQPFTRRPADQHSIDLLPGRSSDPADIVLQQFARVHPKGRRQNSKADRGGQVKGQILGERQFRHNAAPVRH